MSKVEEIEGVPDEEDEELMELPEHEGPEDDYEAMEDMEYLEDDMQGQYSKNPVKIALFMGYTGALWISEHLVDLYTKVEYNPVVQSWGSIVSLVLPKVFFYGFIPGVFLYGMYRDMKPDYMLRASSGMSTPTDVALVYDSGGYDPTRHEYTAPPGYLYDEAKDYMQSLGLVGNPLSLFFPFLPPFLLTSAWQKWIAQFIEKNSPPPGAR